MRCRKVRSFLSAYCRDEISGSRKLAVSEHLSTCQDCRREESEYRVMLDAAREMPAMTVSKDFTTALFNRIAEERFVETRTKAYLPSKRAPLARWSVLIPAVASACLVLLVGLMTLLPNGQQDSSLMANTNTSKELPAYVTAQPTNNPNMTASLEKDWSLATELARAERLNRLSRAVGAQVEFQGFEPASGAANVSAMTNGVPLSADHHRLRTIIRVYHAPDANRGAVNTY